MSTRDNFRELARRGLTTELDGDKRVISPTISDPLSGHVVARKPGLIAHIRELAVDRGWL